MMLTPSSRRCAASLAAVSGRSRNVVAVATDAHVAASVQPSLTHDRVVSSDVDSRSHSPEFRALNPFGRLPVIDDDGVVVSESGAIVLYLARKSGKLMPKDLAGEAQVLRWSFTALTTIEVPVLSLWFVDLMGGKGSKPSEALHGWAEMRLKQLDDWLANRKFIAAEDFTVADILMTHVLDAGTRQEMMKQYPNLLAYRARCTERPAWKKTLAAYNERVEAA